jgi:large subunit ribosomal protein L16
MGKGKGEHSEWVSAVKRGKMLFELAGMSRKSAITVLLHAKTKLALKTSIVIND